MESGVDEEKAAAIEFVAVSDVNRNDENEANVGNKLSDFNIVIERASDMENSTLEDTIEVTIYSHVEIQADADQVEESDVGFQESLGRENAEGLQKVVYSSQLDNSNPDEEMIVDSNNHENSGINDDTRIDATKRKTFRESEQIELGEYFDVGTYDDLMEVLDDFQERTSNRFIVLSKSKGFGKTGRDSNISGHGILWKDPLVPGSMIKNYKVPDDGVPRITVGHYHLVCQYGDDKCLKKKLRRKEKTHEKMLEGKNVRTRNVKVPSKKCGCPAKISIKQIIKYPGFKVSKIGGYEQRVKAKLLKEELQRNRENLVEEHHFIGRLVDSSEHKFHLDPSQLKESIHKDVAAVAKDLLLDGLEKPDIIKKIKHYVLNDMFYNQTPPEPSRRRYFPNNRDLRNLFTSVCQISRCSEEQEEYILTVIEKLKQKDENLNIHFHVEVKVPTTNEPTSDDEFFEPDSDTESKEPSPKRKKRNSIVKKPTEIRTYLFSFQTPKQQRLLKRFGNVVFLSRVLIENQRIKKAIPFYVYNILVQTNVDYQTVGCIVTSREQKDGLMDGLNVIKDWNTYWRPKYFIVDCNEEITKAVETLFPDSQNFLSPHSCEREWLEFLAAPSNELADHTEEVLTYLRNMAYSFTEDSLSIGAALFEGSVVWRKSSILRSWFQSDWLHIAKKWVFGYRPEDLLVMNHLKVTIVDCLRNYEKLLIKFNGSKHCVAGFIENVVEQVAPKDYQQYTQRTIENNLACKVFSSGNRLLKYFDGIPSTVIPYVYDLGMMVEEHFFEISHNDLGLFTVKYESAIETDISIVSGKTPVDVLTEEMPREIEPAHEYLQNGEFTVSFGDLHNYPFCTCNFWQMHKLPCIHMFAIFKETPTWKYDMLSPLYRSANVFQNDFSCLTDVKNSIAVDKDCQTNEQINTSDFDLAFVKVFKSAENLPLDIEIHRHMKQLLHHLIKMQVTFVNKSIYKSLREQLEKLIVANVPRLTESIRNNQKLSLTTTEKPHISTAQPKITRDIINKPFVKDVGQMSSLNIPRVDLSKIYSSLKTQSNIVSAMTADGQNIVKVTTKENLQNILGDICKQHPNAKVKIISKEKAKELMVLSHNEKNFRNSEKIINIKVISPDSKSSSIPVQESSNTCQSTKSTDLVTPLTKSIDTIVKSVAASSASTIQKEVCNDYLITTGEMSNTNTIPISKKLSTVFLPPMEPKGPKFDMFNPQSIPPKPSDKKSKRSSRKFSKKNSKKSLKKDARLKATTSVLLPPMTNKNQTPNTSPISTPAPSKASGRKTSKSKKSMKLKEPTVKTVIESLQNVLKDQEKYENVGSHTSPENISEETQPTENAEVLVQAIADEATHVEKSTVLKEESVLIGISKENEDHKDIMESSVDVAAFSIIKLSEAEEPNNLQRTVVDSSAVVKSGDDDKESSFQALAQQVSPSELVATVSLTENKQNKTNTLTETVDQIENMSGVAKRKNPELSVTAGENVEKSAKTSPRKTTTDNATLLKKTYSLRGENKKCS